MTNAGQKTPPTGRRLVDARLHLLDRQVLDVDGVPVSTVDDLELTGADFPGRIPTGTEAPVISAVLSGAVLATRIFGGKLPRSELMKIDWQHVTGVDTVLTLDVRADSLDVSWVERWIRDHIIARIPGGKHDPQ